MLIVSKLVKKFPLFLGNSKFHFLKYCKHELVISIIVRAFRTFYIEYTRMPSPFYRHVLNLVVSHPISGDPGVLIKVSVLNFIPF